MNKYLAIFCGAPEKMDEWMKLPEDQRKPMEMDGMQKWNQWMTDHAAAVKDGSPLGKTKRVSKDGVADVRNNMGAWTVVEAESAEEAAKMFEGHPHYTVFPGEFIDVMQCMPVPSMKS